MAIDNRLQIFDEQGNPVDYDILASDVKFMPDGKDLPTKLAEMQEEIEDAGSGGYEPPEGGIPKEDLAPSVQQTLDDVAKKVDKVNGKGLSTNDFTTALLEKLNALPDAEQYEEDIADAGKVKTVSVNNGTPATPDANGNVNINVQGGGLTKEDFSVETQGDGTVDINVGSGANKDTYSINLNHTHEGMAKLVVDTAANLPDASEMESDTIYGELDDGEIATIYLGGYPFYGGGGGASSGPVLRRPADGATIDMGQTTSGTVSKTINVKGKSLTQALTIELDNTGYSFGTTQPSGVTRDSATQLTIPASSISAVNSLNGVDIVVVYTGNDTDENAEGALGISSSSVDGINVEVTLITNKVVYKTLDGIKLTGMQWMKTDWNQTADTDISMKFHLIRNERSDNSNTDEVSTERGYMLSAPWDNGNTNNNYYIRVGNDFTNEQSKINNYQFKVKRNGQEYNLNIVKATVLTDNSIIELSHTGSFKFIPGGNQTAYTCSVGAATSLNYPINIGNLNSVSNPSGGYPFYKFDLVIYEISIIENNITKRHYIPCRREGVPGMRDEVTGHFMSSVTSTPVEEVILPNNN